MHTPDHLHQAEQFLSWLRRTREPSLEAAFDRWAGSKDLSPEDRAAILEAVPNVLQSWDDADQGMVVSVGGVS